MFFHCDHDPTPLRTEALRRADLNTHVDRTSRRERRKKTPLHFRFCRQELRFGQCGAAYREAAPPAWRYVEFARSARYAGFPSLHLCYSLPDGGHGVSKRCFWCLIPSQG